MKGSWTIHSTLSFRNVDGSGGCACDGWCLNLEHTQCTRDCRALCRVQGPRGAVQPLAIPSSERHPRTKVCGGIVYARILSRCDQVRMLLEGDHKDAPAVWYVNSPKSIVPKIRDSNDSIQVPSSASTPTKSTVATSPSPTKSMPSVVGSATSLSTKSTGQRTPFIFP